MTEQQWLSLGDPVVMRQFLLPHHPSDRVDGQLPSTQFKVSDRQLRLFACACLRKSWHCLTAAGSKEIVELAERIADGQANCIQDLTDDPHSVDHIGICTSDVTYTVNMGLMNAINLLTTRVDAAHFLRDIFGNPFRPAKITETKIEATHFGVITSKVEAPPSWLTWNDRVVLRLARAAYDERAADGFLDKVRLSILADALEEADCRDQSILLHLRGWQLCWNCGGSGKVSVQVCDDELYNPIVECPLCHGTCWIKTVTTHARGCWVLDLILGNE